MKGKKILVVDDSADIRNLLAKQILGPAGYDVLTANDGALGLKAARRFSPDLLIVDYEMPHLTGLELLDALKQDGFDIPAILITGSSSEELVIRAMRAGVRDYLVKPFEDGALRAAVRRVLGKAKPEVSAAVLERRLRELHTINKIAKVLTSQLDLGQVLNRVVEAAVHLTEAEEGLLMLLDEATGELYIRAAKNFEASMAQNFRLKVSDSLAGEAMRNRMPITLSSANALKITTAYLVKDLIYVPLVLRGKAIGVLGVDNRYINRSFDRDHLRLLTALADYAVIAISNARIYAQTRSERDTLDAMFRHIGDVVILVDAENHIVVCNPAACRAFDIDVPDPKGQKLDVVIPHQNVLDLFAEECEDGKDYAGEIVLENGQTLSAHLSNIDGMGRVVVMQDISRLKELDRVKSDFVSMVSHDLRSPLTAILGYVELIDRVGEVNDAQKEFVDRIIASVQSITALISDLLALSRIEAGLDIERKPTSIPDILHYAVDAERQCMETRQQALRLDISEPLPEVLGNPLRLKQMMINLLENAIKYTPEKGEISIRARQNGDVVIIEVSDTGIGIPPTEQTRIFEKFYRAKNISVQSGTGLGLSIVQSIVKQHDGRVWVNSRVGEGSTFTVVLPAHLGDDA